MRLSQISVLLIFLVFGCGSGKQTDTELLRIDNLAASNVSNSAGGTSTSTAETKPAIGQPASKQESLETQGAEKSSLKLGFIKLTDCAPLVIAKEKGYFADEGLQVEVISQPNWKTLLDNVISGELDGAHMLAGQPLAATIGIGTKAEIIVPYVLEMNGNGITVSNVVWEKMQAADPALKSPTPPHPISARSLKPLVEEKLASGQKMQMAMTFPVSTHNYELRYWLAAGGIHPGMYTPTDVGGRTDAEVELSVTPPPMMTSTLEAGNIQGYCVGEPWNQKAVSTGIGVPVATTYDIRRNMPEKVFGVTKTWAEANPKTLTLLVKALIRAGKWLDETNAEGLQVNREEACRLLSQANYVGTDYDVIKNSMTGYFYFQKSDRRHLPDFNVFFKYEGSYPFYSDGIWFLTQMRRWGQISEPKPASWYMETVKKVYQPDIYRQAAKLLIEEGKLKPSDIPAEGIDGYRPPSSNYIDGKLFDAKDPVGYLNSLSIGTKDSEDLKTK